MEIKEEITSTDDFVQCSAALKGVSSELEHLRAISTSLQMLIDDALGDDTKIDKSAELQSIDLLTQSLLDLRDVVNLISTQFGNQNIRKSEIVSITRLRDLSARLVAEPGDETLTNSSSGNLFLL